MMSAGAGGPVRNLLLRALPTPALDAVRPHLEPTGLARHGALPVPHDPLRSVYFIESGFVSVVLSVGSSTSEIGLVGPEGMLGVPAFLGSHASGYRAVVRQEGTALRASVDRLREVAAVHREIQDLVLRFVQAEIVQVAHTSFANGRLPVIERLARWILMAHDRIEGDTLRITHDVLADALDVRRPGVTTALHELEGERAIRSRRNALAVLDRERLKARAGPAYGPAEAAYQILVGQKLARGDSPAAMASRVA